MRKFKAGDEVRLVKSGCFRFNDGSLERCDWAKEDGLVLNETYIISAVLDDGDISGLKGHKFAHPACKFKLTNKSKWRNFIATIRTLSLGKRD